MLRAVRGAGAGLWWSGFLKDSPGENSAELRLDIWVVVWRCVPVILLLLLVTTRDSFEVSTLQAFRGALGVGLRFVVGMAVGEFFAEESKLLVSEISCRFAGWLVCNLIRS